MSAAATYQAPTQKGDVVMSTTTLRPELQAIVNKIKSLRELTDKTGFFTHRDIGLLLKPLTVDDLVLVNDALDLKPRELPQRTTSNSVKRFDAQGKHETNFNR